MASKAIELVINLVTGRAKREADTLADAVADVEKAVEKADGTELSVDTDRAQRDVADLKSDAEKLAKADPTITVKVDPVRVADAKKSLKDVGDEAVTQTDRATLGGSQTVNAFADLSGPLGEVSGKFSEFGQAGVGAAEIIGSSFGLTTDQLDKMAKYLGPAGLLLVGAGLLWDTIASGSDESKQRIEELMEAQRDLNALQFAPTIAKVVEQLTPARRFLEGLGVTIDDATQYVLGQTDALGPMTDAYGILTDDTQLAIVAQRNLNISYGDALKLVQDNAQKLRDARKSRLDNIGTLDDEQRLQFDVARSMRATNDTMFDQARVAGPELREEILRYVGLINRIPQQQITRILADADPDDVAQVKAALDELTKEREALIRVGLVEAPDGSLRPTRGGLRFLAEGGNVAAGETVVVGDGGEPELFTPRSAGTVTPFSDLRAAGVGMAGSGTTVNIYASAGMTGDEIVAAIRRYERTNGRSWRS